MTRATFDSPRWRKRLIGALDRARAGPDQESCAAIAPGPVVAALEHVRGRMPGAARNHDAIPQHVSLELNTHRLSHGVFARHPFGSIRRPDLTLDLARRIFAQLAPAGDCVLSLDGVGDPLLHPQFDALVQLAKANGIRAVHLRTELIAPPAMLDRLAACGVDVVSVDLHADRASTYQVMMGQDLFKEALLNIDHLQSRRRRLTDHPGTAGFALPWIVPRIQRRIETYEDIDSFYDRWHSMLGAAAIESPPAFEPVAPAESSDALAEAVTPPQVVFHESRRRMTIFCDGSVPVGELDLAASRCAGNAAEQSIIDLWRELLDRRETVIAREGIAGLRLFRP